ncbi:MAG TPA: hypothetical protein VMM18_18225 [Gemmatimonadaceae bacterium]|nr:hypothetical protein [Gemmatimonadaceae bacterium]
MASLELWIRRMSVALVVIVMAAQPIEARAASAGPKVGKGELRMEDKPGEKRLVVTVGPISSPAYAVGAIGVPLEAGGRIVRSAIAHRLRVELVDSAQRPVHGGTMWEATLYAHSATQAGRSSSSIARFDHSRATVDLPKPLGYRLEAGDSVLVVAMIGESESEIAGDLYLVVTIEYEPLDGPVSRLAVVPVDLGSSRVDSGAPSPDGEQLLRRSWDWTPDVGGRILALTGVVVEDAHELVLDDPATGIVLWRTTNRQRAGAGFVRPSQCVRLGVVIEAGRGYRLTAILPESSASSQSPGADAIRALVLPNRASTDLSMEAK